MTTANDTGTNTANSSATNTATSGRRAPHSDRSSWFVRILVGLLIVFVGMGILTLATLRMGFVSGEEISPDTLTRRQFSYFEIPLVHIQIFPIKRMIRTNTLAQYLRKQKYLTLNGGSQSWDLVEASRGGSRFHEGDPLILTRYLDAPGNYWLNWSKNQPKMAEVLWPAVVKLAQNNMYILIPDLFDLAVSSNDAEALKPQVAEMLGKRLHQLASAQGDLGHAEKAAELVQYGLEFDPGNADLKKLQQSVGPPKTATPE